MASSAAFVNKRVTAVRGSDLPPRREREARPLQQPGFTLIIDVGLGAADDERHFILYFLLIWTFQGCLSKDYEGIPIIISVLSHHCSKRISRPNLEFGDKFPKGETRATVPFLGRPKKILEFGKYSIIERG